ncbi:5-formyltetrahydrofolate cyclo-ligase [Deinococcus sp. VB343]|uniref:5-formyltetrahydrofolate cyclo-ligase n=1 Tax=Deinococcus sp. VB343 TaxID=3385567 RepID=UPI0039C9E632
MLRPDASKAEWREWALAVRKDLPDHSQALTEHLRAFLRQQGARRVLAYHALGGEPDVSGLQSDFELLTTRTRFKPERHLTLHPYETATEVSRAGYLQPPKDAPQVALDTVDAVLLPGLAYDLRGVRLGYGGGFYDRLLPGFAGLKIGVVYAPLLLSALPGEAHDVRADWVATERGVVASGD